MSWQVRKATDEDIPAIMELFLISLGTEGGAPVPAFWQWKHIDNPFGRSPVLLAFDGDVLIGLRAFMRWQWRKDQKIFSSFRAVDTATHPAYRSKGIFSLLTKQLLAELESEEPASFIFNTPNNQSKPGYLKMGWQVLGRPKVYGKFHFHFSSVPERFSQYHQQLQCFDFSSKVFDSNKEPGLIHTQLDSTYLQWRYQSIPEIPYGLFVNETGNGSVHLFFQLKKRKQFTELRICDTICSNEITRKEIFQSIHLLAKDLSCTFSTFIMNHPVSTSDLWWHKMFSLQKHAPEITIRKVGSDEVFDAIRDIKNWYFHLGELELF